MNTQHGVSCAPYNTIYHHFTIFATLRLPISPINEGTTNICIMFKIQFQNPSIAAMIVVHITRAGDWNTSLYSLYQFPYTCYTWVKHNTNLLITFVKNSFSYRNPHTLFFYFLNTPTGRILLLQRNLALL